MTEVNYVPFIHWVWEILPPDVRRRSIGLVSYQIKSYFILNRMGQTRAEMTYSIKNRNVLKLSWCDKLRQPCSELRTPSNTRQQRFSLYSMCMQRSLWRSRGLMLRIMLDAEHYFQSLMMLNIQYCIFLSCNTKQIKAWAKITPPFKKLIQNGLHFRRFSVDLFVSRRLRPNDLLKRNETHNIKWINGIKNIKIKFVDEGDLFHRLAADFNKSWSF